MSQWIDSIHGIIGTLNGSKVFAGIVMLTLNIGSRFITFKLSKSVENIIKSLFTKQILVFSIAWMGTRDIYIALLLTLLFTITVDVLGNEESKYCLLPERYKILAQAIDTNGDGVVSQEEIDKAVATLDRANKAQIKTNQKQSFAKFHSYLLPSSSAPGN